MYDIGITLPVPLTLAQGSITPTHIIQHFSPTEKILLPVTYVWQPPRAVPDVAHPTSSILSTSPPCSDASSLVSVTPFSHSFASTSTLDLPWIFFGLLLDFRHGFSTSVCLYAYIDLCSIVACCGRFCSLLLLTLC